MKLYYNADISMINAVISSFSMDPYRAKFNGSFVSSLALQVAEYIKSVYLDINDVLSETVDTNSGLTDAESDADDFITEYYNDTIFEYAMLLVREFGSPRQPSDPEDELPSSELLYDDQYEDQRNVYVADLIYDIAAHMHESVGPKIVIVMDIINVYDDRILYEIHAK
jgi:hypothetical protein